MSEKLEVYRKAEESRPKEYLAWEIYNAGFENVGREGKPVSLPLPKPGENELLARVDAVGLCFSDIKVITMGPNHPRLIGRDLKKEPVVPGHEVSVTVVEVGEKLQDRFQVGEKFVVQADAFYKGQSMAFGYVLRGGAAQYTILNEVLHSGDAGSYLLPVQDKTGYSAAALSEPWACVECSYHLHYRSGLKPHGKAWFIGVCGEDLCNYYLGEGFEAQGAPRKVLMTDLKGKVSEALRQQAFQLGFELEETVALAQLLPILEQRQEQFDDIILLGKPRPELVERLTALLGKGGQLAIVCKDAIEQEAEIDIGRVHYDRLSFIGTATSVVMEAYKGRNTSALLDGGSLWLIGAGGPMGQMHLQRALDRTGGPKTVLASDVDETRLQVLKDRFLGLAEQRNKRLLVVNGNALTHEFLLQASGGQGFSDIVLLAPVAKLAEQAWKYLNDNGMLNIFAGVARGTKAKLRLGAICARGGRVVGSSGSALEDMRFTLGEAEAGRLATDKAVAAIGGIYALREGLAGVAEGKFPGKVVIYPQLDFPLIPLTELKNHFPAVAAKLEQGHFWNREAEAALLEELLG